MTEAAADRTAAEAAGELIVTREPPLAWVALHRPRQRNAMNFALWQGLAAVMARLGADDAVRVVVLRGAGDKAFAAGADITELAEVRTDPGRIDAYLRAVERVMQTIEDLPKPVLAMVNGAAVGGGCEIATACDLRLASDRAQLGIPAGNLSIVITFGDVRRLAALVGLGRAKDLLMTGRLLGADEAHRIGLVDRVFPHEELERETRALALDIATKAPLTLRGAKAMGARITRGQAAASSDEALRHSVEGWHSADFAEGIQAYVDKRPPVFRGR